MKNFARIIELPDYQVLLTKTNDSFGHEAPQLNVTFCLESGLTIQITGGYSEHRRAYRDERFETITADEVQVLIDTHRRNLETDPFEPNAKELMDAADTIVLYRAHPTGAQQERTRNN